MRKVTFEIDNFWEWAVYTYIGTYICVCVHMHVCVGMSLRLDQFPVKSLLEWAIEVTAKVAKLRIKFFYLQIRNIYTHT